MNILRHTLAALAVAVGVMSAMAAITDLPVKTINGKQYYYYEVQPQETLYSLPNRLGISRDMIVKFNPSVEDGLLAYQVLYFPLEEVKDIKPTLPGQAVSHEVKKGDTIYGVAKNYGITTEQLIELNPSIKDGLKAGETILIKPATTIDSTGKAVEAKGYQYTIADGETLYGIAKAHGITTEELLDANPGLNPATYRSGQSIFIPYPRPAVAETTTPAPAVEEKPATQVKELNPVTPILVETAIEEPVVVKPTPATTSIGVILPFMLKDKSMSKQTTRYTEFYKGLILAVDSMKTKSSPIAIYAYDSSASMDSVKKILRNPNLKKAQLIIAPPDANQYAEVARWGADHGIMVINPFLVKSDLYLTESAAMQCNIPSAAMQDKAVKSFFEQYGDRTLVILRRTGAPEEHAEFVEALKQKYLDSDRDFRIITYSDQLTQSNLARLADIKDGLVFLSYDGKLDEAKTYLPALAEYRGSLEHPDRSMVIGYPEWITFRGDAAKQMGNACSVIYSRFYSDPQSIGTRLAKEQFKYWYGESLEAAVPSQGLLGLDLGTYIIRALRSNGGDFSFASPWFEGVQNGFHFVHPDDAAGWVNDVIFLINYRPSGVIDAVRY